MILNPSRRLFLGWTAALVAATASPVFARPIVALPERIGRTWLPKNSAELNAINGLLREGDAIKLTRGVIYALDRTLELPASVQLLGNYAGIRPARSAQHPVRIMASSGNYVENLAFLQADSTSLPADWSPIIEHQPLPQFFLSKAAVPAWPSPRR